MVLLGDSNNDGVINITDAKIIAEYLVGNTTSINLTNSNINNNSEVSISDAARIADHVAGIDPLDTTFKCHIEYTDPTNFLNEVDKATIASAVAKWTGIIKNRIHTGRTYDMIVYVDMVTRSANILASAGPYVPNFTVNGKLIPYAGVLELNTTNWGSQMADVKDNGETTAWRTVVHELGHIFGIGTLWPENNLVDSSGWYVGTNALREYRNKFNDQTFIAIPIEDDGGGGTAGGHLEEGTQQGASENDRTRNGKFYPGLNTDLMTGWAETNTGDEPLTRISIGLLEDLGYEVVYS